MKSSTAQSEIASNIQSAASENDVEIGQPLFEELEGRRMMSTVELTGGVLTVTGNPNSSNTVSLTVNDAKIRLTAAANAAVREFNINAVNSIRITGGSQADTIYLSNDIDIGAWIDAGAGDDFVQGGGGNDTITGGTGNDVLSGFSGADVIYAGAGDDSLAGGSGSDTLYGGRGGDILFGRRGGDELRGGIGADVVWGGQGNDTLAGGTRDDNIDGKLGDNVVTDGSHTDVVFRALPAQNSGNGGDTTGGNTGGDTTGGNTGGDSTGGSTGGDTTGGNTGGDTTGGNTGGDTTGGNTGGDTTGGGGTVDPVVTVPAVVSFTLMNVDTGLPIRQLSPGTVLDLKTLGTTHVNVVANLGEGTAASVRFSVDNSSTFQVDNSADYALNNRWTLSVGAHTVTATAFGGDNSSGIAGDSKTVTFTVIDTTPIVVEPTNKLPTVRIVNPLTDTTKVGPAQYVVRAQAADSDGSVSKVEFYAGNTLIGVTNDQPYSVAWTDVLPGTYKLTARAFDNEGAGATSTIVTVTVKPFTTKHTYYVSPVGNDASPGSSNSPFKTISKAAQLAGAGDTVLINPGTYRESVLLKKSGTSDQPITFKAVTPGTVVIDGADVIGGWTKGSGAIYSTDWSYDFTMAGSRTWGITTGTLGYAEQFMVGNTPLVRVGDTTQLREGSFAINYDTDKVYVWLPGSADARSTQVLGSTRKTLFAPASTKLGTAENIRVDGLTFRHAANFMQNEQAGVRTDNGWVVVDSTVKYTNSTGLGVRGNDVTLLRVTAEHNGQNGLGSGGGTNVLVKDSTTRYNDYRKTKVEWEAGGGKWAKTDGVFITNYKAYGNWGPGIWFDIDNTNFVVENSEVYDNVGVDRPDQAPGIFMEISPGPARIENNYVHDNAAGGVRIAESANVIVQNNLLVNNLRGIELRDMANREHTLLNVTLRNNKIRGWAESAIGTQQGKWDKNTAGLKNIKITGNTYDFTGSGTNRLFRWGPASYLTLDTVKTVLGFDKAGLMGTVSLAA